MSVCESWWRASFTRLMLVAVLAGAGQLAMADDLDVTMLDVLSAVDNS